MGGMGKNRVVSSCEGAAPHHPYIPFIIFRKSGGVPARYVPGQHMCSRHDGYGTLTNSTMFRYAMLGVHRSPSQRGRGFGKRSREVLSPLRPGKARVQGDCLHLWPRHQRDLYQARLTHYLIHFLDGDRCLCATLSITFFHEYFRETSITRYLLLRGTDCWRSLPAFIKADRIPEAGRFEYADSTYVVCTFDRGFQGRERSSLHSLICTF